MLEVKSAMCCNALLILTNTKVALTDNSKSLEKPYIRLDLVHYLISHYCLISFVFDACVEPRSLFLFVSWTVVLTLPRSDFELLRAWVVHVAELGRNSISVGLSPK